MNSDVRWRLFYAPRPETLDGNFLHSARRSLTRNKARPPLLTLSHLGAVRIDWSASVAATAPHPLPSPDEPRVVDEVDGTVCRPNDSQWRRARAMNCRLADRAQPRRSELTFDFCLGDNTRPDEWQSAGIGDLSTHPATVETTSRRTVAGLPRQHRRKSVWSSGPQFS